MSEVSRFLEFSRPFIDSSKKVFQTMVFTKLDAEKPRIKQDSKSLGDYTAMLGLMGEVSRGNTKKCYRAMLVLSFPCETYLKIASAMLMETFTEYTNEISDVGGEICNMIMGNAKRVLSEIGYTSNMAIPSMIEGIGHTIKYPQNTTVILIPLNSAHGMMYMELCYKED